MAMVKILIAMGIPSPTKPSSSWDSPVSCFHVDLCPWTARYFHVDYCRVADRPSLWVTTSVQFWATAEPNCLSGFPHPVPRPLRVATSIQIPTNVGPFCLALLKLPLQSSKPDLIPLVWFQMLLKTIAMLKSSPTASSIAVPQVPRRLY